MSLSGEIHTDFAARPYIASGSSFARAISVVKGQLHALRAFALEDEGVERIERLEGLIIGADRRDRRKQATLRRIRIDVVEIA